MARSPSQTPGSEMLDRQQCVYCGLPTLARESSPESVYCCLGCRIADGIVSAAGDEASDQGPLIRLGMAIFFAMNVMVFTLVLWTWNVHDVREDSLAVHFREIVRYACLLFTAPVLILLGTPLFESCLAAWRERRMTTDVLLGIGVVAAFVYSVISLIRGDADIYFEVVCMILIAVTLGKWLEATARRRATRALQSLQRLLPENVRRVSSEAKGPPAEFEEQVPLESVRAGDLLRILVGERVPVDGEVVSPHCCVDEQIVTGESVPRERTQGEAVFAGSLQLSPQLLLRATAPADQGTVARLIAAVEQATRAQCEAVRLADRVAAWFVPLIVVVSVVTFAVHFDHGVAWALMTSLSVVLIACPCALGIATPLALWAAMYAAAQRGVLVRSGDALLALARVRSMAFDKTGTITDGQMQVTSTLYDDADEAETNRICRLLARSSSHVLAKALSQSLPGSTEGPPEDLQDLPGRGVRGTVLCAGTPQPALLGSLRFAKEQGLAISPRLRAWVDAGDRQAMVCVGWKGRVRAAYRLADRVRVEAPAVIEKLQQAGVGVCVLTGDRQGRAAALQRELQVPVVGQLLPQAKVAALRKLPGPRAMVGDGMNDTLALVEADVAIALDCGADVSRETADVCLLGSSLTQLPWALEAARATRRTIRTNLLWAVAYNIVGMGFAASGQLNPIVAAVAMVGSSLFVVTQSLTLIQRIAPDEPARNESVNTENVPAIVQQGA